jgi:hypothetical protein
MGVWCDSLRNQLNEETGAVKFARSKVAWLYALQYRNQFAMVLFSP